MRDYEQLLTAGNRAQLEKLKENEHKSGFDDINLNYAIERIKEEVDELIIAKHEDNKMDIRREAADIANFAHIIILACDKAIDAKIKDDVRSAINAILRSDEKNV